MNKNSKLITKEELKKLNDFIKNVQPKDKNVFKRTERKIKNCNKVMINNNLVEKTNYIK